MSNQDYVRKKAEEALTATAGNRREASLLLRVWTESDEKLRKALVAPFLANLCALAVQRALSGGRRAPRQPETRTAVDAAALLSAIGSRAAPTMSTVRPASAPPPPSSSARHRQAVSMLAAAFRPTGKKG